MSEKQRQDKQRYLRQNILDRDYDAEQFMDFCESYKGSIDIDSWTLNELKEIVQKFINTDSKTIQKNPFQYKSSGVPKHDIDWDKDFEAPPKKQSKQIDLNLNLIDLDFLQSMGSNSPSPVHQQPPPKTVVPPPKIEQKPVKIYNDDPSAILARLNDKNSNQFISAYNSFALNTREKQKQGVAIKKTEQKPLEKKTSELQEPSPTNIRKDLPKTPQEQVLIPTSRDTVVVGQNFKTSIKCRIFSNKPKLDKDYDVTITGHQIINPNPFVPNYVLYTINTNPLGVEVKRRLKDFQTLRNLLRKNFPTIQIPFFQRYGRRLSETEPATIKKQKLFLQSFLNGLLMNKKLRCKIIDDFFLCQKLDSLKKIFRDFQKLDRPKSIEDLYSNTGRLQIDYNNQKKKYVSQQQLYFDYLETNLTKLKELYDQLTISISNSVRIIHQISDLYDNLRDSTKNVNGLLDENLKSPHLEATFDKISDLHKHWALSMKTQAKVLEVQVRHICRYEATNLETIRQICKSTDNLVDAYERRDNKIEAAREQYEFNKRLNQYKTGVQSPSKNTTVLRYQAGHFLHNTVQEIQRYLSEFGFKMTKRFNIFSDLQLNICQQLQKNWLQFQTFYRLSPYYQK